jgi:hypothetical protein
MPRAPGAMLTSAADRLPNSTCRQHCNAALHTRSCIRCANEAVQCISRFACQQCHSRGDNLMGSCSTLTVGCARGSFPNVDSQLPWPQNRHAVLALCWQETAVKAGTNMQGCCMNICLPKADGWQIKRCGRSDAPECNMHAARAEHPPALQLRHVPTHLAGRMRLAHAAVAQGLQRASIAARAVQANPALIATCFAAACMF